MSNDYIHWRENMDMPYLRAEHLKPKERRVLTIKEVRKELMPEIPGKSQEEHQNVAYFEEEELPMVLNVTNCETIEQLYGTGNILEWVGKKIQIFATKTKVKGQSIPCLRVDKVIPKSDEITYYCSVCGKEISKDLYDKSVAKYGKPYCSKECLETDTNGKQVL